MAKTPISGRKHDEELDIASSEIDAFLKLVKRALEARKPAGLRPFPVLVAGKDVDLLLLSRKAKVLGGYEKISAAGMWGDVSKELGFEPHCAPSVKLVYLKYLKVLETGNVLRAAERNAQLPLRAAEQQEHVQDAKRRRLGKENLQHGCKEQPSGRAEKEVQKALKSPGAASSSVVTSLASPLEWMRRLALDPGDPRNGQGLPNSVQDKQWVQECFLLANRIRSCLWKKEDPLEAKQRTPRGEENWKQGSRRRATQYSLRSPKPALPHLSKRVPIGATFQANVPPHKPHVIHIDVGDDGEDDGSHSEADAAEFMGKVVWPRVGLVLNTDRVGKGSSSVRCSCVDKKSIQCVKVHVDEAKEKLRMELGETFKYWGFDKMGESVAEEWRLEEQKRFKAIVGNNPGSKEKDFWAELPVEFPQRSRKDLVSFYFNVFMLRRRAVQNRIGVKTDSDDDEGDLPESASISGDRNLAVPDDAGEEAQSAENLHAGTSSASKLRI